MRIQGYNFIELVVIIAIISILMVIAVPLYKSFVTQSRVLALAQSLEPYKDEVLHDYLKGTTFGTTTEVLIANNDSSKPENLYELVRAEYGCLEIEFDLEQLGLPDDALEVLTLVFCPQPESDGSGLAWSCGYSVDTTADYVQYLPMPCQEEIEPDVTL